MPLLARLQDIEARQRALDAERAEVLHEWVESGECAQQRGLADPVGPHHAEPAAWPDGDGNAVEHRHPGAPADEMARGQ